MIERFFKQNKNTQNKKMSDRKSSHPIWIPSLPTILSQEKPQEEVFVGSPRSGERPLCPLNDRPFFSKANHFLKQQYFHPVSTDIDLMPKW